MSTTPQQHLISCHIQETGIEVVWKDLAKEGQVHTLPVDPQHPLETPLPEFNDAVKALGPIAQRFIEMPAKWWKDKKVHVNRLFVGYNKYGARSVKMDCLATLKGGREWKLRTPTLRMDDAIDGEKNVLVEVEKADKEAIETFIAEAHNYAAGGRSQGDFFGGGEPDDDDGEALL